MIFADPGSFADNMMNTLELRAHCAQTLLAKAGQAARMSAFVGLDGFVDEILRVVDKRESAEVYQALPTIAQLAQRLAAAAGKSTNLELVSQVTKLGGNGPIMANALATFGIKVTYLGNLGYPNLHPVFTDFAKRADVHSIADPGATDALEFDDGKIMLGKHGLPQGRHLGQHPGPLRTRPFRRQLRRGRPHRLCQLDDASRHERCLGVHLAGDLPRPAAAAPPHLL